jgi:hypothetical protein
MLKDIQKLTGRVLPVANWNKVSTSIFRNDKIRNNINIKFINYTHLNGQIKFISQKRDRKE